MRHEIFKLGHSTVVKGQGTVESDRGCVPCVESCSIAVQERKVGNYICGVQVALLQGMKATGRLLVLVQALTSPKLAAVDDSSGAVPAPLQVRNLSLGGYPYRQISLLKSPCCFDVCVQVACQSFT